MKVWTSREDYLQAKIEAVASYIQTNLSIEKVSHDTLQKLSAQGNDFVLETSEGVISQINTILRYIAQSAPTSGLTGDSSIKTAEVDQWLEFAWNELDVPIQAQLATKDEQVHAKAHQHFATSLTTLETHLDDKTFLTSERPSLADVSVAISVHELYKIGVLTPQAYPNVFRWYMTLKSISKISSSFKSSGGSVSIASKWGRSRIRIKELLKKGKEAIGTEVVVKGWIRTIRNQGKGQLIFAELTDGSTVKSLQLVLDANSQGMEEVGSAGGVGACISCLGKVVDSPAKGQTIEVHVLKAQVLGQVYAGDNGEVGGKNYPLAKKQHTLEYLREIAHLRPRTKVFSSALRVRHAMAFATHEFFNSRGFVYIHTPCITSADCEGAGEQFTVSSLLGANVKSKDLPQLPNGELDFSKDFFGKRTCLTVSGQLNVETTACALSDVYTFGPTFRAENSHTSRHLAEFWMIEPETCFAELEDVAALAEDYVKYCTAYALEHCKDDLEFFENEYAAGEKGLQERLRNVLENDFQRITYTEAVEIIQRDAQAGLVTFEKYPQWGDDLGSEHERYITEKVFKKPTIVSGYPKGIKAFYMRVQEDGKTVAAMDILVPKIGELIGGSQREERLDVLEARCVEMGLHPKDLWWYLDLRRFGTVPHGGFGLGFERLIMFITGLENIRDVIPFPRWPGNAEF